MRKLVLPVKIKINALHVVAYAAMNNVSNKSKIYFGMNSLFQICDNEIFLYPNFDEDNNLYKAFLSKPNDFHKFYN